MDGGIELSGVTAMQIRQLVLSQTEPDCQDGRTWPSHLKPGGLCFPIAEMSKSETCPACDGDQVKMVDGKPYRCQSCSEGRVHRPWWRAPEDPRPWVIGQVLVVLDPDRVWLKAVWKELTLATTNIKDLFPTLEAAQAECDRRNAERAR